MSEWRDYHDCPGWECYEKMSDEELKELAKERVKRTGAFKKTAIKAQQELWRRSHWADDDGSYDDGFIERSAEEIDYNGYKKKKRLF